MKKRKCVGFSDKKNFKLQATYKIVTKNCKLMIKHLISKILQKWGCA